MARQAHLSLGLTGTSRTRKPVDDHVGGMPSGHGVRDLPRVTTRHTWRMMQWRPEWTQEALAYASPQTLSPRTL